MRNVSNKYREKLSAEIAGLDSLDLHQLRARWKLLYEIEAPVPTKNSEGVEKSSDLFRSAVVSPACTHSFRNSSHGSAVGFAAA
jgi:hypothetical protein